MISMMFFLILSLIGCSSEIDRDQYAANRNSLPVAAIPHLPDHGLIVIRNGFNHSPERIIADLSRSRLKWIEPKEPILSVWSDQKEFTKSLSRGESHLLLQQWEAAYTEEPNITQKNPTERFDEILILIDGSKTRTIRSRGPIQQEKSKAIIDTLKLYVGEADTQSKD